jgi:hypothetical protein
MCDYDVLACKAMVYLFAVGFSIVTLDFFIVQLPKIQEQQVLAEQTQYELDDARTYRKISMLKDVFSDVNINVRGRMNNNVQVSGHLYEYEQ